MSIRRSCRRPFAVRRRPRRWQHSDSRTYRAAGFRRVVAGDAGDVRRLDRLGAGRRQICPNWRPAWRSVYVGHPRSAGKERHAQAKWHVIIVRRQVDAAILSAVADRQKPVPDRPAFPNRRRVNRCRRRAPIRLPTSGSGRSSPQRHFIA